MVTSTKEKSAELQERTTRDLIICGVTGGLLGAIVGAPVSIFSYLMWKAVGVKGAARWWAWGLSGVVITPVMLGVIAASNNVPKPMNGSSTSPNPNPPSVMAPPKSVEQSIPLTMNKFNQVTMGMSYEEVYGILGVNGVEQSRNQIGGTETVMMQWQNPGIMAGNMHVIFQNGRASSKAQFGLK